MVDCTHHRSALITHLSLAQHLSGPWYGAAQALLFLRTKDNFILCTMGNLGVEAKPSRQGDTRSADFAALSFPSRDFCFLEHRHLWIALIAEHPWDH